MKQGDRVRVRRGDGEIIGTVEVAAENGRAIAVSIPVENELLTRPCIGLALLATENGEWRDIFGGETFQVSLAAE